MDIFIDDDQLNGVSFAGYDDYQTIIDVNSVNEWTLNDADEHPFHL